MRRRRWRSFGGRLLGLRGLVRFVVVFWVRSDDVNEGETGLWGKGEARQ